MRKYINIIVSALTIVCIIISIKLSTLPLLPIFAIDSFWNTSSSIREAFSFVYDVCIGFLLSAFFYFLVEVVPDRSKKHRAKILVCCYVNILMEQMEQIISICEQIFCIKSISKIYLKDLTSLNGNIQYADKEISYLTTTYYNTGKKKTAVYSYGKFDKIIKDCIEVIEKQLQNIKRFGALYSSNESFLETIASIESSVFITNYKDKKEPLKCFLCADTDTAFYEFYLLYYKMQKLRIHTEYTSTKVDSDEESARYKEQRESGEMFNNVLEYNRNRAKAYHIEHPVIIYREECVPSNVIPLIKQSIPYIALFDMANPDYRCLQDTKLLIILSNLPMIDSKKLDTNPCVFRLKGRFLPEKISRFWDASDSKCFFYKANFSIFGIKFNAEHPTKNEIQKLLLAIDDYIRKKYSLELNM